MKVPAPPPDFSRLFRQVVAHSERTAQILRHVSDPMTGDYLPWDKLRFHTPPGDLTHEEWWLATKVARRGMQRTIPLLRTKAGEPFVYALPDRVLREIEFVNRNASGHITISEQVTNPATRDRYVISSLIEESITSSQLEGAVTSRRVAKEMLRTGRSPRDKSEQMILNNYVAMRRITERRDHPLTPELILEIHRIVTEGTLDDPSAAGQLQDNDTERVAVWGEENQLLHRPPPATELPARIEALCAFANGSDPDVYVPPLLRALTVHFMMGYDHYFVDGNGRTARAVFYWSMLHQGFWLTEFLTISRILRTAPAQYARSFLLTEQDDGDLTHFFVFHLGVIHRAVDDLHQYLATKASELRSLQATIQAMPGEFNYRQLAILNSALADETATYTARSHAASHGVTGETARRDLLDLEEHGLLARFKAGRQFAWRPATDLPDRLRRRAGD